MRWKGEQGRRRYSQICNTTAIVQNLRTAASKLSQQTPGQTWDGRGVSSGFDGQCRPVRKLLPTAVTFGLESSQNLH
jgi:hypothetical protein